MHMLESNRGFPEIIEVSVTYKNITSKTVFKTLQT